MDIYSIGEMVIDFIPGAEPNSYVKNAGGAPANVAIAVAKNGLDAGMCCSLGEDDFGHFLHDCLIENNVRCLKNGFTDKAITTMAFVTLDKDGDRSFTFARKPGADMFLEEDDVKESDIDNSYIVHASSCSLSASPIDKATEKLLKLGHEKNKLVSFDMNYRNLMWNDDIDACSKKVLNIMKYVDLLKVSEEELPMIVMDNEKIFDFMKKYDISLIVETLGGKGCKCFFNNEMFDIDGFNVKCVDATGAGDSFWGAFLSYLRFNNIENSKSLNKELIIKAAKYGNASGAICVQSKGAIPSIPTREQIEKMLSDNNE